DEDEVEEELEPGRPAIVLFVACQRPQARGLEEARERAHLLAAKFGLALLDECGESLVRVLRGAGEIEGASLEVDARGERRLECLIDGLLRESHRDRALR